MAMALDSDGGKEIDYREFKELRRRFKLTEPIRKAVDLEYYEDNLVPRAFPLKVGGAGKGPGIGWSRVHLTP